MRFELFKSIVDQIAAYPQNHDALLSLHIGGEPLLHKNIVEFISYASDKGMKPMLTTNATLLSPEMSERLLRSGLHKIKLSFEGIDRNIYETTRIGAKYEVVLGNIIEFVERNRAHGKPVSTELVVVDLPYVEAQLIRDFCQKMRPHFDMVNLSAYFDWLGKVTPVEFERSRYFGCSAVDTDLNVLWDGRVVPCCMDVDGEMVIGDFNKMSYLEVLTAKERQDLRLRLKTGARFISGLKRLKSALHFLGMDSREVKRQRPESARKGYFHGKKQCLRCQNLIGCSHFSKKCKGVFRPL